MQRTNRLTSNTTDQQTQQQCDGLVVIINEMNHK